VTEVLFPAKVRIFLFDTASRRAYPADIEGSFFVGEAAAT
jgi:hypothetical protein